MQLKGITDEDFLQFKESSMFLIMPFCDFKCERECGIKCCQNSLLAKAQIIEVDADKLIDRYLKNPITTAVTFGGMEPMLSFDEMLDFIERFRKVSNDTIIIYTGYYKEEISEQIERLKLYKNIIIKFGRFIPDAKSRYDEVLGVTLQSDNQYAEQIS